MATLRFEFVAQDHILYEGDVNMVIIPGTDGVIGIMPKHAPLMAVVAPGEVLVRIDGRGRRILRRWWRFCRSPT